MSPAAAVPSRLNAITHVQSSELSRNAAAVFRAAEQAPVVVTRRDGEPLVLASKAVADEQDAVMEIAAALIGVSVSTEDGDFANKLATPFPWMLVLNNPERHAFADELVATARACFSVGQPNLLLGVINAWKATAEARAAGIGHELIEWLDEAEEVRDPRA